MTTRIALLGLVSFLVPREVLAQTTSPFGADSVGVVMEDTTVAVIPDEPWDLRAPDRSATCLPLWAAEQTARGGIANAEGLAEQGPPLPPVPWGVSTPNARLYSDPERRSPLRIRASDGTFTPTQLQTLADNRVSVVGTFTSGGSSYQAYADPADVGLPNLVAERARQSVELRVRIVRARTELTAARIAAERCERDASFRWRQERTRDSGYFLTRATRAETAREDQESYSAATFNVQPGDEVYVGLVYAPGEPVWIVSSDGSSEGWVPDSAIDNAAEARAAVRPHMERRAARRAARDAAIFASSPAVLITEFRAVADTYSSGFTLSFQNLRRGKTLDYLRVTVQPYNRVGDVLGARSGGGQRTVSAVGPVEPSTSSVFTFENESVWFTDIVDCVRLVSLRAEYADGSTRSWSGSRLNALFGDRGRWDTCSDR